MTQRAFKFRFYPTPEQADALNRTFGAARFVWNKGLAIRIEAWEQRQERISGIDVMRLMTQWKQDPETSWLRDVSAVALQQTASACHRPAAGRERGPVPGEDGLPAEFGNWNTIWKTFTRWRDRGV